MRRLLVLGVALVSLLPDFVSAQQPTAEQTAPASTPQPADVIEYFHLDAAGNIRAITNEAIMSDFAARAAAGEKRKGGKGFEEYKLQEDYDLRTNNCTTICLGAMGTAQRKTGVKFPGYEGFKNENDPRDLFGEVGRIRGEGVSVQDVKKRPE